MKLTGDGSFKFEAEVVGQDIVLRGVRATCFGGAADPEDSGETASGISTKAFAWLAAVSLPMDGRMFSSKSKSFHTALDGSPIPRVPWGTMVQITHMNGVDVPDYTFPVIDLGPAKRTGNALDLTIAAARIYSARASATNFTATVDFAILGGAKYLR